MTDVASTIGSLTFVCLIAGIVVGMVAHTFLPEWHRTKETEDIIRLAMGVVATMSALVIGLLIASAKSSFDAKDAEVKQLASDLILLDRQLAQYGPDAADARDLLRRYTVYKIDAMWPEDGDHAPAPADGWRLLEAAQASVVALTPGTANQRWLQTAALQTSGVISQTRWLLHVQSGTSIPTPFLIVLIAWLTLIMASFGLFAPRNATVETVLVVCALSIAGAIFLILEMAKPFSGLIHISSLPMREALAFLGQ